MKTFSMGERSKSKHKFGVTKVCKVEEGKGIFKLFVVWFTKKFVFH